MTHSFLVFFGILRGFIKRALPRTASGTYFVSPQLLMCVSKTILPLNSMAVYHAHVDRPEPNYAMQRLSPGSPTVPGFTAGSTSGSLAGMGLDLPNHRGCCDVQHLPRIYFWPHSQNMQIPGRGTETCPTAMTQATTVTILDF